MKHRALVAFCTYNPGVELLGEVERLLSLGFAVLIVDDASAETGTQELLARAEKLGSIVFRKLRNSGIADSLEWSRLYALDEDFDVLVTMDQDTRLGLGYSPHSLAEIASRYGHGGYVVPLYVNDGLAPEIRRTKSGQLVPRFPIQSGSVFPTGTLRQIGAFRSDFVMDSVDHDYYLRVLMSGYEVRFAPELSIQHVLGAPTTRNFVGKRVTTTNHSPARRFWQFRNRTVLLIEYRGRIPWAASYLLRSQVRQAMRIVLFEPHRVRSLRTMASGLFSGWAYARRGQR